MKVSKRGSAQARKGRSSLIFFLLCFTASALIFSGCTKQESMYKDSRVLMDTYCTITVVGSSKADAKKAIDAGFSEIKRLETLLNYFSDKSELAAINRAAGEPPVKVSAETLEIIKKALYISESSGGAFDATLAPVIKLWDFSKTNKAPSIPPLLTVQKNLALTGFQKIFINEERSEVQLPQKNMEIDLGGIAKGYAADRALSVIKEMGTRAALVAIAGDIRGFGMSTTGRPWKVGIQNPRTGPGSEKPWEDVIAALSLENRAVSTSGDYQRYFMVEGKRFHHILDPRTGFPAKTDLISASVIAPEGYISDGLSTAVFVLGKEKGLQLLEKMRIDGVLVDRDKRVFVTDGLKGKVEILNTAYQTHE